MMRILRRSCIASFIALGLLLGVANPVQARVSIDVNLSLFPDLVRVPGYPVYYAPGVDLNFFFYDGLYWLYEDDDWYVSDWYNGPWEYVDPDDVPLFVLRVPVRYYRRPPPYFRGWRYDAPPMWGHRWGGDWERSHRDWDHWDRQRVPAPAPLPDYQRRYSRDRYPDRDQQRDIRDRNYNYQPRDFDGGRRREQPSNEGNRMPERRDERNDIQQRREQADRQRQQQERMQQEQQRGLEERRQQEGQRQQEQQRREQEERRGLEERRQQEGQRQQEQQRRDLEERRGQDERRQQQERFQQEQQRREQEAQRQQEQRPNRERVMPAQERPAPQQRGQDPGRDKRDDRDNRDNDGGPGDGHGRGRQ